MVKDLNPKVTVKGPLIYNLVAPMVSNNHK